MSESISFVSAQDVPKTDHVPAVHPADGDKAGCPYFGALEAGNAGALRDVARLTIRHRVFGDDSFAKAEQVLIGALQADPQDQAGETNHLLGLTYFHLERWGDAMRHLEVAVARAPSNADAAKLLDRSRINGGTGTHVAGGPTAPLNGQELLKPPALHLREPENLKPFDDSPRPVGAITALFQNLTGKLGGLVAEAAIKLVALFGRDRRQTFAFESWDRKGDLLGKLELGGIRNELNGDKLVSTYDRGTLVGFQQPGQRKPEWTDRFRTATGAWTTEDPMEGAAGTEFQRTGAPAMGRQNRALDQNLPSPREVSRAILQAKGPRQEVPFLNNLAIPWIQFQNHDWVNHRPQHGRDGFYKIPLADDDPLKTTYGIDNMYVPATSANPLEQQGKITFLNEVTHWWDASQIYGSDQATQDRLRMGADGKPLAGGKLRIDGELLPLSAETGVADSGFTRNWWAGLELFHALFVMNHNSIAEKIQRAQADWSSDQIFQITRLVNAAVLAKIHTVEWTPAVLPNRKLTGGMATNWWGLIEQMRKPFEERRIKGPLEPQHPVLGGIVGGARTNHGKPYGLSEEFVEVYRLHAGMSDHIDIKPVGRAVSERVKVVATRGTGSRPLVAKHGLATLLNSFGHQHMHALVHNNYPEFMNDMSMDGTPVFDLGALDILRARERGIPPYNQFRRDLGLNPLESFKDLGVDDETAAELERLYGKGTEGIEKMDLLVGTSCEVRRPQNYGFGETLFHVFIQMATRRLQADPFYTDKFDEKYYTKEGMDIIEHATLKSILLEHFPELKDSGLSGVNNAFEPWGTTAATHPQEHPLTSASESYLSNTGNGRAGRGP